MSSERCLPPVDSARHVPSVLQSGVNLMSLHSESTGDVIIVGGGFSGLSIAALLAQNNVPVTLLETSELGAQASTVNQGWLYSGAWFARRQTALAQMCHESYKKAIRFCPECLEPGHTGMLFAMTSDSDVDAWTTAWDDAGIPWTETSLAKLGNAFPASATELFTTALTLPDRSMQPHILLRCLADKAVAEGARIHTGSRVTHFKLDDQTISAVVTGRGEEFPASLVIIATGANDGALSQYLSRAESGRQSLYARVTLQTHLIATPQLTPLPFCIPDFEGFNHLPHFNRDTDRVSVFGIDRWNAVASGATHDSVDSEFTHIEEHIQRLFPNADLAGDQVRRWSGTTVQAMHVDQVEPGRIPLPTVIDHASETPSIQNLLSVYPGRATLWTQLAETCADIVIPRLHPASSATTTPPWAT